MKERLNKLLTIKSIVTIITTIVFAILSLKGDIKPNEFIIIFSSIIGYYFGTQKIKETDLEQTLQGTDENTKESQKRS